MNTQNNSDVTKQQVKELQKKEIQSGNPSTYWQRFKAGNSVWLTNFYSKCSKLNMGEKDINDVVNNHRKNLEKLKGLLSSKSEGLKKKQVDYMDKFAAHRKESYVAFKVCLDISGKYKNKSFPLTGLISPLISDITLNQCFGHSKGLIFNMVDQRSQDAANNMPSQIKRQLNQPNTVNQGQMIAEQSHHEKEDPNHTLYKFHIDRYQNYMNLTLLLSNERFRYKYIVKHYFVDTTVKKIAEQEQNSNVQKSQFVFETQRGIAYSGTKGVDSILNPMIVYLMVRDLFKAIMELEDRGIFHADIKATNTVCICSGLNDLTDKSKWKDITFKLIDFDRAYLVTPGQGKIDEQLYAFTKRIFNVIDKPEIEGYKITGVCPIKTYAQLLSENGGVKGYQLHHAYELAQIIYQMHLQIIKKGVRNEYDWDKNQNKIYDLAKNRQYKELGDFLNKIIDEQVKKGPK